MSDFLKGVDSSEVCHEELTVLKVCLLTGGIDRPYALGLARALAELNVELDVIGSETVDSPEMHSTGNINFYNLWPVKQVTPSLIAKIMRILRHYSSLVAYSATARPTIFHILWNSKIQLFDRTLLMLYFRVLGKRVALTAHNVNQAKRDLRDSWLNRLTLRIQYHLANHIFVHTGKMKDELIEEFGVAAASVTVIRHPVNDEFPDTNLTPAEAKRTLGLGEFDKVLLSFGRIKPYKGLEYLLQAFEEVAAKDERYKLIIAGDVERGNERYMRSLVQKVAPSIEGRLMLETHFIPDEEAEIYFKAADVFVLPYRDIFQSGVLFLGLSFGLPVIVTDVGSFREDVFDGENGYVCKPEDPIDLARTIELYFNSDLYRNLATKRGDIKNHAHTLHSWGAVADQSERSYQTMLRNAGTWTRPM